MKKSTYPHVKYVIFDKDNTLTLPYINKYYNSKIEMKVKESIDIYGFENVAILSNSVGSSDDKNYEEAKKIENEL